jgi:hypothetical protein
LLLETAAEVESMMPADAGEKESEEIEDGNSEN